MRDPLSHTLTPDASSSPLSPVPFTSTKPSPPWQARAEARPNIQHPLSWVCVGEKGGAALGKLIFLLMNLVALHIPGQALQAPGKGHADQGCPALSVGQLTPPRHQSETLQNCPCQGSRAFSQASGLGIGTFPCLCSEIHVGGRATPAFCRFPWQVGEDRR